MDKHAQATISSTPNPTLCRVPPPHACALTPPPFITVAKCCLEHMFLALHVLNGPAASGGDSPAPQLQVGGGAPLPGTYSGRLPLSRAGCQGRGRPACVGYQLRVTHSPRPAVTQHRVASHPFPASTGRGRLPAVWGLSWGARRPAGLALRWLSPELAGWLWFLPLWATRRDCWRLWPGGAGVPPGEAPGEGNRGEQCPPCDLRWSRLPRGLLLRSKQRSQPARGAAAGSLGPRFRGMSDPGTRRCKHSLPAGQTLPTDTPPPGRCPQGRTEHTVTPPSSTACPKHSQMPPLALGAGGRRGPFVFRGEGQRFHTSPDLPEFPSSVGAQGASVPRQVQGQAHRRPLGRTAQTSDATPFPVGERRDRGRGQGSSLHKRADEQVTSHPGLPLHRETPPAPRSARPLGGAQLCAWVPAGFCPLCESLHDGANSTPCCRAHGVPASPAPRELPPCGPSFQDRLLGLPLTL